MKLFTLLFSVVILLGIACKNDKAAPKADETKISVNSESGEVMINNSKAIDPLASQPNVVTPPIPGAEPPQNAAGVWHYTCPNGCAGGGGAAGPCATCGTTLAHNTNYHSSNAQAAPGTSMDNPIMLGQDGGLVQTPATAAPKAPEPAQNASGVWHYTCPNGCSGGAGSATACSTCGTTLAHNAGYH